MYIMFIIKKSSFERWHHIAFNFLNLIKSLWIYETFFTYTLGSLSKSTKKNMTLHTPSVSSKILNLDYLEKQIQLLKDFKSKSYNLLLYNTYKLNKIKYNIIGLKQTSIENRFSSNAGQLSPQTVINIFCDIRIISCCSANYSEPESCS